MSFDFKHSLLLDDADTDASLSVAPDSDEMICPPASACGRRGLSASALDRTNAYINQHLGDSFGLSDLAQAALISRFHFARLFRESTGHSPMEFVLKARMEAAKQMLKRDDQKIAATAAALGFFDQSHFTRTFRRMTGVSPSAFSRLNSCPIPLQATTGTDPANSHT